MPSKPHRPARFLSPFFLLALVESLIAIGAVFIAPSESGAAWLLGLSRSRWILVALLVLLTALFTVLLFLFHKTKDHRKKILSFIQNLMASNWYWVVLALSLLGLVSSFYLGLLSFKFTDALILARLYRLRPVFFLTLLLCLQSLALLSSQRSEKTEKEPLRPFLVPILASSFSLAVVAGIVSLTRLGLQPDRAGWDPPGVPLMTTQVFLAWLLSLLFTAGIAAIEKRKLVSIRREWIICVVLWLFAVVLWSSQPLSSTFFSPRGTAPNFAFYPYSDAATHDLVAQNILVGEGFGSAVEKPLYSLFLVLAHVIVGQDYANVVIFQIGVVAIFPALLYLIGAKLHSPLAGGLLAIVVILREANAIALSGQLNVSHVKLLMTETPTALALAALCLVGLRWMEAKPSSRTSLLMGGLFGAVALLRSQTLVFLPLLLLLAFLPGSKTLRKRALNAGFLALGLLLVALPWLFRNQIVAGQFGFSQSLQGLYLAKQYSLTPELADPGFPAGTPASEYSALGFARVVSFTTQYPREVLRFVLSHFAHNEISSFLSLPTRFDFADRLVTFYNLRPYWIGLEGRLWNQCCSLNSYVNAEPYWSGWNGTFPPTAFLPITINLTFLSIGLGVAWRKYRWLGLLPLGIHLLYNFSTSLARVSGWRLNLPVDWVLLLYYCIGISQLTIWVWSLLSKSDQPLERLAAKPRNKKINNDWKRVAVALLCFGLLLPLADSIVPSRYQEIGQPEAVSAWSSSPLAQKTPLDITAFLEQPGAVALRGRVLWPRFYSAGAGEPGGDWPAYNPLAYSRISFMLVGPSGNQVALPLQIAPGVFPNASDVIVYGCQLDGYLRAIAVIFPNREELDLLSNFHTFSCEETPQ